MRNSGFINIGYGNIVASGRIIAIVSPEAAPVKRLVQEAKAEGNIIDATCRSEEHTSESSHLKLSRMPSSA